MSQANELTFQEKVDLMKLVMDLRTSAPVGVVGLLETRNLFARLFPDFAEIRDKELDDIISNYASSLAQEQPELQYKLDSAILDEG